MKICPETSRLTALREGWLDDEDARRLREHLETCPSCRAAGDDLEALLDMIDAVGGEVEPPPGGYDALLTATLKMRDRILPIPAPARPRWYRAAVAVAAIMLISVTAFTLLDPRSPDLPVTVAVDESEDIPGYLLEEHARASDLVPFSDSSTLMVLANQGKR